MGGSSTSSTSSYVTTNSDSNNTTTELVSNLSNVGNVPINIGSSVGTDNLTAILPYAIIGGVLIVVAAVLLRKE